MTPWMNLANPLCNCHWLPLAKTGCVFASQIVLQLFATKPQSHIFFVSKEKTTKIDTKTKHKTNKKHTIIKKKHNKKTMKKKISTYHSEKQNKNTMNSIHISKFHKH